MGGPPLVISIFSAAAIASGDVSRALSSTLAIWPYDTPHKVGILRRPLGLFAGRSGRPTRKKSPTAGFSERDPHRMMHMRDLDERLV